MNGGADRRAIRSSLTCVLALLALTLAGCAGGGDEANGSTTSVSGSATSGTASSAPKAGGNASAANRAPTANLTANATSGSAPLLVNFTLGGRDADGDALSWRLDFGDGSAPVNGTALPASIEHSYAAGNHSATLTVSDGKANATANATVAVAAGAGGAAEELCPTDAAATKIPAGAAGTYYVTSPTEGDVWAYEETNGIAGLQRDDGTVDTECPTPDLLLP